jgi:L-phenylalanine/L-methionine N-acetyltransferase
LVSGSFFVSANAIGIALYEKFGFEIEGTHRHYAFPDGEHVDACSMARIKPSSPE